jgi:hypothetical protein
MNFDWKNPFTFLQRLSARERNLLGVAVAAAAVIAFYTLVWEPLALAKEKVERQIRVKQQELVEIQDLRTRYMELLNRLEASRKIIDPANFDENFSLFPHIESTVGKVLGGRDKIRSMSPKTKAINDAYVEEAVELKLDGISLTELVEMMYSIEKGEQPLRFSRLSIKKRRRDPHQFDVTATVSMLKPNKQAPAS